MTLTEPISVMIVDDVSSSRWADATLIDDADDMCSVAEAWCSESALRLYSQVKPDVVIVNLQLAHAAGLALIAALRASDPQARVLARSSKISDVSVVTALRAGANGFLSNEGEPAELLRGIREVHIGNIVLSRKAAEELTSFVVSAPQIFGPVEPVASEALTEGELCVVTLLARGQSNSEIALTLHLSEATIKTRLAKIMEKWGVRTRVQVAIRGIRSGIVAE